MAGEYFVQLSLVASRQVQEIFDYISPRSPQGADKTVARIMAMVDSLAHMPERYRPISSRGFGDVVVRSVVVHPYVIRYHVDLATTTVTVLDVRHGRRRSPR